MPRIDRMVPRDQLKPNPRNARTHSRKQIREIANSIAAFGFTAPIITDESGLILAGHGRFAAAAVVLRDEAFPLWPGRVDEARNGSGPDQRGPKPGDTIIPDLRIGEGIKVKTRDFR